MRQINIGGQGFEDLIMHGDFYVDKTYFIKEWWENRDSVTLITRPRRFGKTLSMDMLKCFFSNQYAEKDGLFEGLEIWKEEKYRDLQGTYPVISLSFANVKQRTYQDARSMIVFALQKVFDEFREQWNNDNEDEKKKYSFMNLSSYSSDAEISISLNKLSSYLNSRYGKKVLIFLDEYDTPLQEAYIHGYWDEMADFTRGLFNSTFKTNQSLERGLLTGITRVSKESIFSDLNNLQVITTTTRKYETCFGFTQKEVDAALEEYSLTDTREMVKKWYDGFTFGNTSNIYNPWSILQYLDHQGEFAPYWANTSSNALISHELQVSDDHIKSQMEDLLNDGTLETEVDEQIVFTQLETNSQAIWSLFLASGYLKVADRHFDGETYLYTLCLTNLEVKVMFRSLISQWFGSVKNQYGTFMKALISRDSEEAEDNLKYILMGTASFYDTRRYIRDQDKPESFYHGLVLGMVAQEKEYRITSNRESGYGRYDIMMKPLKKNLPAVIIEFKVFDAKKETTLENTAERALKQIADRHYDAELISDGIDPDRIIHYGMGFKGKDVTVLIG